MSDLLAQALLLQGRREPRSVASRLAEQMMQQASRPQPGFGTVGVLANAAPPILAALLMNRGEAADRQAEERQFQRLRDYQREQMDEANAFFSGRGQQPAPMAQPAPMPNAAPMAPAPMLPPAGPRGDAPAPVVDAIAARRALDPNSPTYAEDIQRINNGVMQQTLPGMAPQPVSREAPGRAVAPASQIAPIDPQQLAAALSHPNPMVRQRAQAELQAMGGMAQLQNQALQRQEAQQRLALEERRLRIAEDEAARGARNSGVPAGFERNPNGEGVRPIPGGPQDPRTIEAANAARRSQVPPSHIQRAEDEDLQAIGGITGVNERLREVQNQLQSGRLDLGPVTNLTARARNAAGVSSENSRNFASFQATLESLRNESLRLNAGVQTEGDALRAWNELVASINDPALVQQRLAEIQAINRRAVELRRAMIQQRRVNAGLPELDTGRFEQPGAPRADVPTEGSGQPQGSGWSIRPVR